MAEEKWIVDRIEGNLAVVEDEAGQTFDVPADVLPADVKEGDVLGVARGPEGSINSVRRDAEATLERRRKMETMVDGLRGRDPGPEFEL